MFSEEAVWINGVLTRLEIGTGKTVLDIGSSTESFRCLHQPFVDFYIFKPLRERGARVIHVDARESDGVDVVCDISSADSEDRIKRIEPADVMICTNFLEHVLDRDGVIRRIKAMTKPGGFMIITVPYKYRYHEDPIDTLYRPSNLDLENFFSVQDYRIIESRIIDSPERIPCGPSLMARIFNKALRLLRINRQFQITMNLNNKVAVVVVQKKESNL